MKKTKYLLIIIILGIISVFTTACGTDRMDGIEIGVTNYANEYIVSRLYSDHSTITSIYPDGVDTSSYKLSKKQKNEFAHKEIFVYNGLIEAERNLAVDLLEINDSLKIIDTAYVMETDYSPEELWLNPSSLLMMSQNVKNGLLEYIDAVYLQKDINEKYSALKIDLSNLDVEYRDSVKDTNNKNVVVDDSALLYLEKFGLTVYCIDSSATDKTIATVDELIANEQVNYIITFKNNDDSNNATDFLNEYSGLKKIELHKLDNLTDDERDEKKDYLTIMEDNLSLLNQELYQ